MSAVFDTLPEVLREPVEHWFERFGESTKADALARIVACSEFAGTVALREKEWLLENVASFEQAPDPQQLEIFVADVASTDADVAEVKSRLRRFRNRYMLHVLWRETFALANLDETLNSLSLLADRLLDAASQYSSNTLAPRYGNVRTAKGSRVPPVILGMGKLGGYELNFSSDVDLIFLYPEAGETDGAKRISAQEYFGRWSRQVIALVDETTADGFVFRMDTRLRPFGESGPPVASFGALESYLLQHGRDWERYAYVKARIVGPHPGDDVAYDLYRNLIQPFVYRRYIDFGVFESLREMHAMIAAEVQRRELQNNIKLGPGGIREAEFIVQSLQLVRGGREPQLQSRELLEVLPLLVKSRGLSADSAEQLRTAYRFLRRVENFIQAMRDRQTHDLPESDIDRVRLCLAMGYCDWQGLRADIEAHRSVIADQFAHIAFRESLAETPFHKQVEQAWESDASEDAWSTLLESEEISEARPMASILVSFAAETVTRKIDAAARLRLQRFVPQLLQEIAKSDRPLRALMRTLTIVERILRRSAYLALLNENRGALARLVDLCARSNYIADQIARFPLLLDELLDPRLYSESVTRADLSEELRDRLNGASDDSESCMQVISQFQRSTMFRIAVADFNGKLPIMKVSDGLTWLAESVLEETLRVAWHDLIERHGVPRYTLNGMTREAGFGIVAYGKLGGLELSYGSDLDIVFLHDSCGEKQVTDGDKPLDNGLFFGRLVRRLVHFLTTQTGSGQLYEIDTRLRPDGRSGLLVTSTDAFERYQEENAWTWEHQALLRARAVAGSGAIADEFERIRRETLVGRVRRDKLRDDVVSMRQRMRKELDRSDEEQFDLKHGRGGIGDIEFLVQYLVLEHARAYPDVIFYSDNIRQLDALMAEGCIAREVGEALQEAYRNYRLLQHHLVLDDQTPLVGQNEFAVWREFVAKTWDEWLA
ncbi:MAG: bifunctional [glutamate--ammonia ligase]-adenylyl-L-tyrosine phosphorylase/[glutamate--ammonia-ligase] adenylyltransferase [Gammaproteobacteria bacterium]|nr:bifunctional [glutamate--ammonia ligase]-adenylyl-L-tyrosine phosphorylase/[glutamate--ammonia-ligase] adenylyltransferase [Gammaproteobacteria bacterium]